MSIRRGAEEHRAFFLCPSFLLNNQIFSVTPAWEALIDGEALILVCAEM